MTDRAQAMPAFLVTRVRPEASPSTQAELVGELAFTLDPRLASRGHVFFARERRGAHEAAAVVFGRIYDWPGETVDVENPAATLLRLFRPEDGLPRNVAGEFSFLHWDGQHQLATLGCDQAGCRPVYHLSSPETFAVATDIDSLRPFCRDPEKLDPLGLYDYLSSSVAHGEHRTLISEIRKVPAAHTVTLGPRTLSLRRYWSPAEAPAIRMSSAHEYHEAGRALLKARVEERTNRSHPVGLHVSGGLDSSIVAKHAVDWCAASGAAPPLAYAWQSPPSADDVFEDRKRIAALSDALGLDITYCADTTEALVAALDADPVTLPLCIDYFAEYMTLKQASADGVGTILSGWGGDQAISYSGRGVPPRSRALVIASTLLRDWPRQQPLRTRYLKGMPQTQSRLDTLRDALARRTTHQVIEDNLTNGFLPRRMTTWSVMAAPLGLQYSYPLTDRRVLDFAMGVPAGLYRTKDCKRSLMRGILRGVLPDAITDSHAKAEPSRFADADKTHAEWGRQILRRLERGAVDPARAAMLDMDHLADEARKAIAGERHATGRLMNAASFVCTPETDTGR